MDRQAPIIGNLALKPEWDKLSESEADFSFELESKTAPSNILQTRRSVLATSRGEVVKLRPLPNAQIKQQQIPVGVPDLFESAGITVGEPTSHAVLSKLPAVFWGSVVMSAGVTSGTYLASSQGEPRLINHVIAGQFAFGSWNIVSLAEGRCSTSITSLAGSFPLLRTGGADNTTNAPLLLADQISKLHDEFAQWPGSYNQLLLAGSLDYCKSALKKAVKSNVPLREEVLTSVRNYYAGCLGILDQCRDAKATLRRLNLQKIQDKFEILQDSCSKNEVYPRLAELDLSDIPGE